MAVPHPAPHPKLIPLLQKHQITWEAFIKRGRPAQGGKTREIRAAVVTELHSQGTSWSEMIEVTGLSNGSIQRLTKAMWNPASRANRQENCRKVGSSWKGRKRPGQLETQWASGAFDALRGRVRPEEEREKIRAGYTPELRRAVGRRVSLFWDSPGFSRDHLLAFHRSPLERARRSQAQCLRMLQNPVKYLRGRAQWVLASKSSISRILVRSSYEAAAVRRLESDPEVLRYWFEPRIALPNSRWILPDFVVEHADGSVLLVEVKSRWVFEKLPLEHRVHRRLRVANEYASSQGWSFAVWTERDLKGVRT